MDGRTRRWAEHNEAQRRRIVDAAVALYDEGHADPTLKEIGDRAGVSRSVVYRQFRDRDEFDRAVQQRIVEMVFTALTPTFEVVGTPRETLRRAAAAYIGWAAAHPRLHRRADLDMAADGPVQHAIDEVAATIGAQLVMWFGLAGAQVTEADRAATEPLVHGLVGGTFAIVRHWVRLGTEVPDAERLTDLVVEAAWAVIEARARAFGLELDPDIPADEQLPD